MSEQRDPTPTGDGPQVLATRRIPPEALDPDALQVIHRLRDKGHKAYLVGGCVRDLFLGHRPKDSPFRAPPNST